MPPEEIEGMMTNLTEMATWEGGPEDGQEIGVPTGCRAIYHVVTTYADVDQESIISEYRTTVPIVETAQGLRIMYYQARTEGAIDV